MTDTLRMTLLGPVVISQSEQEITGFRSRKALALFVYLACTQGSQQRESLADLLWGECSQQALSNLRTALVHLRDRVGDCLQSTQGHLTLNPQFSYWVDAIELQQQLGVLLTNRSRRLTPSVAEQVELALQLYKGDFLAGFHIQNAPYFEEWVLMERERLRRLVIEGYQCLVAFYKTHGEYKAGLRSVDRWLALDRLDEIGHSQRIYLLAADGQRSAALAHYETCRRILKDELGVAPAEQTRLLYEQIRIGYFTPQEGHMASTGPSVHADAPVPPAQRFNNLPTAVTQFIGRRSELKNIADCLAHPGCRLLTITGLHGMGKTALMLQAAVAEADAFTDGVCYVPMSDTVEGGDIARVIADVLKIPVFGKASPQEQVIDYLRQKHLLLLLDNLEYVRTDTAFVTALLQHAPSVKVLGTSVVPLNHRVEWLLPLHGLPVPDSSTIAHVSLPLPRAPAACDLNDTDSSPQIVAEAHDALHLFILRARQAQPDFQITMADLRAITQICRLVDGMPLAIEMATEWVSSLSCPELATELERDPTMLTSVRHDIPPRQHSLEAIIIQEWQGLTRSELQVVQNFETFGHGVTREVIQQVTGANLSTLAALVQKSFLRRTAAGRYEMSELLGRYMCRYVSEPHI